MSTPRNDALGDRVKAYESRSTGRKAMPGLPVVVRLDGKGFSKFTRGMARPYDTDLADMMQELTADLVALTQAVVGYTQSDEITLVFLPTGPDSVVYFDGRFQKIESTLAGRASAFFALRAVKLWPERVARQLPVFDARAFEVPNIESAYDALLWRELDATKNAVSMAARAYFPHKALNGKSSSEMQEMLFQARGINFNDYPARFKRGVYLKRRLFEKELDAATLAKIPEDRRPTGPVVRSEIVALDLPPLRRLTNPMAVLFEGADPVLPNA